MHRIFYEVNCEREKLIKNLEGQRVLAWTPLEDLALRSQVESEEFQFVVSEKGEQAVTDRKKFLQLD